MNLRGDLMGALVMMEKQTDGVGIGRVVDFGRSAFMPLRSPRSNEGLAGEMLGATVISIPSPITAADLTTTPFGLWCQLRMPDLRWLSVTEGIGPALSYFTTAGHGPFKLGATESGSVVEVGPDERAWAGVPVVPVGHSPTTGLRALAPGADR
jgi:hypothetical protein